jgi:hypothetical protein
MRVSDDRYTRDRQRLDLALRLIRHEARTFTIRQWTGLSDDRVRKLYRSYCAEGRHERVARHRGKSPRQAAFFFRSPELRFHAANLASLFLLHGLLRATSKGVESSFSVGSLESCVLICRGYEDYRQLHSPAFISFEHAWFLLLALGRHDEIALRRCAQCGGVRVHDMLAKRGSACVTCPPGHLLGGQREN